MQFEEFDKKIKEASEHYHPAYDETAWKKMNQMLEAQLPQKKDDRRRFFYLLLLLVLLTGGVYIIVDKPWHSNDKKHQVNSKDIVPGNSNITTPVTPGRNEPVTNKINTQKSNPVQETELISENESGSVLRKGTVLPPGRDKIILNNIPDNRIKNNTTAFLKDGINSDKTDNTKTDLVKEKVAPEENGNQVNPVKQPKLTAPIDTKDVSASQPGTSENKNEITNPDNEPVNAVSSPVVNKKNKRFKSNLGFTVSAGPDISAVRSSEPGKTTLYYGAGIVYDISKHLTLRSGFYVTNKIYSASGTDYKLSYNAYPTFTLTSVDAECKIFEVPLIVSYNFIQDKRNKAFASLGASSFFMQKESYHYHYVDPMGQYRYGAKTYNNQNQHYFSVATLAAGYERRLNKIFSVIAEPYVKLPLTGVGEGQIKLNSAGVLFTVSAKPFAAKDLKK